MTPAQPVVLALVIPVAGAAAIVAARKHPNVREACSLITAALLFASTVAVLRLVIAGDRPQLRLFEILPGLGVSFHAEPLGAGFAVIVAVLWFVTVLYSIGYMRAHREARQTRFYFFFAIAIAATIGGALAGDLLTLYLFYELLTLATWPLVTHGGRATDHAGGHTYLAILLGTSLSFLLLAIAWTYSLTGSLMFTPGGILNGREAAVRGNETFVIATLFALFLFGTGKAALAPFHRWLPAAMVAPTPVSALLHAVAVVKLGVFSILKVSLYIFGLDTLSALNATIIMQYVAAFTLLYAAVVALRENNLKRRLAYSTISQLAYIVLAATLANTTAMIAGSLHIAVHAFAKITLFFCAGMIFVSLHKTEVSELDGIGRQMPVTLTAWVVASLCVIGMPLTGGLWSKWYLAGGAMEAGQPVMLAVILLGSLLAAGYLLPPAVRAFYGQPAADMPPARLGQEAPGASLAALLLTSAAGIALFFFVEPVLEYLGALGYGR